MKQVEQVRPHRCHARTAADVDHLRTRVFDVELAVRAAYDAFVAGLQPENVGRTHARIDLHPRIARAVPRRRRDADVEHHDVAFGRVVCHRIGAHQRLRVHHFQVPQPEFVPLALEGLRVFVVLRVSGDVNVLVLHRNGRHIDLDVASRFELEVLAFWELHHKLLDERGDVVIRKHRALPLLDAEDFFRNLDFHVLADLHLATETPVCGDFFAREVRQFCREDVPTAGRDLALALHTGATATACGRQEDTCVP